MPTMCQGPFLWWGDNHEQVSDFTESRLSGGRQVRLIIKIDRITGGGKFHGRGKIKEQEGRERERDQEAGHLY